MIALAHELFELDVSVVVVLVVVGLLFDEVRRVEAGGCTDVLFVVRILVLLVLVLLVVVVVVLVGVLFDDGV